MVMALKQFILRKFYTNAQADSWDLPRTTQVL